jgi:hypothetical protein
VIAIAVHAQRPFGPGRGIVHTEGRVLGEVDQLQCDSGRQRVAPDRPFRQTLQSAQQFLVR